VKPGGGAPEPIPRRGDVGEGQRTELRRGGNALPKGAGLGGRRKAAASEQTRSRHGNWFGDRLRATGSFVAPVRMVPSAHNTSAPLAGVARAGQPGTVARKLYPIGDSLTVHSANSYLMAARANATHESHLRSSVNPAHAQHLPPAWGGFTISDSSSTGFNRFQFGTGFHSNRTHVSVVNARIRANVLPGGLAAEISEDRSHDATGLLPPSHAVISPSRISARCWSLMLC
jgi:hypothetical protein